MASDGFHVGEVALPATGPTSVLRLAVCGIAADPLLAGRLALRGGAALHLVYRVPRPIKDLDFVVLDWLTDPAPAERASTVEAVRAALTRAFATAVHDWPATRPEVLAGVHVELGPRLRPVRRLRAVRVPAPVPPGSPAPMVELLVYHLEDLLAEKLMALLRPPPHHHRAQDVFDIAAVVSGRAAIHLPRTAAAFMEKATAAGLRLNMEPWADLLNEAIRTRTEKQYVYDRMVPSGGRPIPFQQAWAMVRAWVGRVQAARC